MTWNNDLPGNAPVGLYSQDSGVFSVVKFDLRVPELGVIDVHQHRGAACCQSRWWNADDLTGVSPEHTKGKNVPSNLRSEQQTSRKQFALSVVYDVKKWHLLPLKTSVSDEIIKIWWETHKQSWSFWTKQSEAERAKQLNKVWRCWELFSSAHYDPMTDSSPPHPRECQSPQSRLFSNYDVVCSSVPSFCCHGNWKY